MSLVAIDTTKGIRKTVLLTNEQIAEVERFIRQTGVARGRAPSESAALAELVQEGLRRWREREKEPRR